MDARSKMAGMTAGAGCSLTHIGYDAFLCHPPQLVAGIHRKEPKIDSGLPLSEMTLSEEKSIPDVGNKRSKGRPERICRT